MESARLMMEAGRFSVEEIARKNGFGNREWMQRSFVRAFGQSSQAIQRMVGGLVPQAIGRSKPKWQRAKESFGTQQLHSPRQGPRRVA